MNISVLKFGGSSVSDFDKIKNIAQMIKKRTQNGEHLIVVVSAMGKTTDTLLKNVASLTHQPKSSDLALLLTTGEQQTISYLSMILNDMEVNTSSLTGFQAGIKTRGHHLKSKIEAIDSALLKNKLSTHQCLVIAGFQGINEHNEITTLGRGGSDTTAVALASALNAPCEIYTDVSGVYAVDPRKVHDSIKHDVVSYEEMMEMSALGAGVLETRCVEIAHNYQIPIYLAQTLSEEKGTWIMSKEEILEKKAVTGLALDEDIEHVTLRYNSVNTQLIADLFKALDSRSINIDMISQIVNDEGIQFSFTFKNTDDYEVSQTLQELQLKYTHLVYDINKEYSKISLIGSGMRDMSGVAHMAFHTLIQSQIPFYQTTTSEISISYCIDRKNGLNAIHALSEAFHLKERN